MASASTYSVLKIPNLLGDDDILRRYVDKYRDLRLQSLQSNPDSFSSTFAGESKQPPEFWTGRMLNPRARHFIGVRLTTDSSAAFEADDVETVLEAEWVGTLVVIGPTAVASDEGSPWKSLARGCFMEDGAEANSDSAVSAYHLAGFYVDPEARGQGLGSLLVNAAVASIVQDTRTMRNARAICTAGASHTNLVVRRLFKRMGFIEVAEEECNTEDGRHLTEVVMRRDVVP